MAARKTAVDRQRDAAKDILDRAEREIRRLVELGVDVVALNERFDGAKGRFGEDNWPDVERDCGEILVLAKSMQAITSASLKAGARAGGKDKLSESARMEISRMVSAEVGTRVEAVARTLPTASSIEEAVQNKIQEALVTGGLISRLEAVAADKAQAAVAGIPRFTAKDAQAAANLVVQRALTQFLSSKELAARVGKAVEAQVTKALKAAEKRLGKEFEALVNTRVASIVSQLPTKEDVSEAIDTALRTFLKDEPLEELVLVLAAERAKAEVERAPDLMSEAASKIARQEADALFKTHMRSKEFGERIRLASRESANDIISTMPTITQEDVEVISRRVGEESLGQLADSDILREKIETMAKEAAAVALSAAGFDKKARAIAEEVAKATPHVTPDELKGLLDGRLKVIEDKLEGVVDEKTLADAVITSRRELMTNEDFATWIKDGTLAVLGEAGIGDMVGLDKKFLTKEKAEKIIRYEAATAAMDLLEKKEFARGIAEALDQKVVRAKLEEIAGGSASSEEVEKVAEAQAKSVVGELLESPRFAKKVKAVGGDAKKEIQDSTKKLVDRVKKIEMALPALVRKMLTEKLGDAPAGPSEKDIDHAVEKAVASKLDPKALQAQVVQIASNSIKDIANSPDFKAMLDGKFKVMMKYMSQEVIPKQITRIMGGG